jgi:protein-tyrosine phosphatase
MSNSQQPLHGVLFVCMGNICRSPMAEGAFRSQLLNHGLESLFDTDSAGTHGYHTGASPDQRAQESALRRGIDISSLRCRTVEPEDYVRFDHILAMDQDNLEWLLKNAPEIQHDKIQLLLDFSLNHPGADVPDPYYGPPKGFERVLDLIEDGAQGLLTSIRRQIGC